MMKGQTSRGGRIWTTIGGFTGLLAIVSIVIAYLQLRQADKASLSSDFTQASVIAIINEQLAVQREIATAQANPVQSGPTATIVAERIAQLVSTQEALEIARRQIEATQTAIIRQGVNTGGSTPQPTSQTTPTVPSQASIATPNPGQTPELVRCPQRIDFGLTIQCSIDAASEIDTYTFDAQADDRVMLRMARASETLQPWIRVFAPDKAQVCESYAERLADLLDCHLPRSGTYSIQVADSSRERKETGNYTLYLQRLNNPGITLPIAFGQPLSGSIGRPTQIDTYSFEANVDDRILIRMLRASETVQPWIRVYAPDGRLTCEAYAERFVEKTDCIIPRTGLYTVLASDASRARTETGNYTLYIQRLNNPGRATLISPRQALSGTIASPAEIHTYTFEGRADDKVVLRMNRTSETIQPWMRVYAPNGVLTCEGHSERQAEAYCTLPRSGTYTLLVADASRAGTETGAYSLSLTRP
jgi:hypothetical protein